MGLVLLKVDSKYAVDFFTETKNIISKLDFNEIIQVLNILISVKKSKGRIFFIGSGGGAGHASHACSDFRKIVGIESYSVSDNVSELTARINDDGWSTSYVEYLKVSNLKKKDLVFVISVGGGDQKLKISENLVNAMNYAKKLNTRIVGIVGRNGGHLAKVGDAVIIIPTLNPKNVTTQVEGLQSLLWHMMVTYPPLNGKTPKWESTK